MLIRAVALITAAASAKSTTFAMSASARPGASGLRSTATTRRPSSLACRIARRWWRPAPTKRMVFTREGWYCAASASDAAAASAGDAAHVAVAHVAHGQPHLRRERSPGGAPRREPRRRQGRARRSAGPPTAPGPTASPRRRARTARPPRRRGPPARTARSIRGACRRPVRAAARRAPVGTVTRSRALTRRSSRKAASSESPASAARPYCVLSRPTCSSVEIAIAKSKAPSSNGRSRRSAWTLVRPGTATWTRSTPVSSGALRPSSPAR